jgi:hypothetical protein
MTTNTGEMIKAECASLAELLLEKNRRYGDSALDPVRVFSRSDSVEQIKVRIDDKLSRLSRGSGKEEEDVVLDLLGYLILLRVAQKKAKEVAPASVRIDNVRDHAMSSEEGREVDHVGENLPVDLVYDHRPADKTVEEMREKQAAMLEEMRKAQAAADESRRMSSLLEMAANMSDAERAEAKDLAGGVDWPASKESREAYMRNDFSKVRCEAHVGKRPGRCENRATYHGLSEGGPRFACYNHHQRLMSPEPIEDLPKGVPALFQPTGDHQTCEAWYQPADGASNMRCTRPATHRGLDSNTGGEFAHACDLHAPRLFEAEKLNRGSRLLDKKGK